jgi:hypothetical protein
LGGSLLDMMACHALGGSLYLSPVVHVADWYAEADINVIFHENRTQIIG